MSVTADLLFYLGLAPLQPAASRPAGQTALAVNLSQTLRAVFDRTRWTLRGSEPGFGFLSEFWV
jgi:hypothetical protein